MRNTTSDTQFILILKLQEILMNFVGTLMWLIVGAIVLGYWIIYDPTNHFNNSGIPRVCGIIMGMLSLVNALVYLLETYLTYTSYRKYICY